MVYQTRLIGEQYNMATTIIDTSSKILGSKEYSEVLNLATGDIVIVILPKDAHITANLVNKVAGTAALLSTILPNQVIITNNNLTDFIEERAVSASDCARSLGFGDTAFAYRIDSGTWDFRVRILLDGGIIRG